MKRTIRYILVVLVGIGCAVALWFYEMNEGIQASKIAFILFIGKLIETDEY